MPTTSAIRPARMTRFVRQHPLLTFVLWFFTVGQAIVFVPLLGRHLWGLELPAEPFIIASSVIGLLLPTIAITWITDGPPGLLALRRRALAVRTPARWYGFALVVVPVLALAATSTLFGSPVPGYGPLASAVATEFLVQLVVVFLTVNLWEEVAWMGLVQARLQDRHGAMRAALLTAPLFALGHISQLIGDSLAATLVLVLTVAVVSMPFRALLGWIYNRTDSLFMVGLVHGATNAVAAGSVVGVGMLDRLYPDKGAGGLVIPLFAVVGLVVILGTRARLGRTAAAEVLSAGYPVTARPSTAYPASLA